MRQECGRGVAWRKPVSIPGDSVGPVWLQTVRAGGCRAIIDASREDRRVRVQEGRCAAAFFRPRDARAWSRRFDREMRMATEMRRIPLAFGGDRGVMVCRFAGGAARLGRLALTGSMFS